MIDLNDEKYTEKKFARKEDLLKYYSEYEYFRNYVGEFEPGQVMCSPLRVDKHPSFNIFYSDANDCMMYKDFATGDIGDFIDFVQNLYKLPSFTDAVDQIIVDFNLQDKYIITSKVKKRLNNVSRYSNEVLVNLGFYDLQIKIRDWTEFDLGFWNSFGISLSTLKKYYVVPISYYFSNGIPIRTDDLSYAYIEKKDDKLTYKIYRPFQHKDKKWRTNHHFDVHQGYSQLPKTGKYLIITKSLKDVMALDEIMKIPAIAIQSETTSLKEVVLKEYKNRFVNIFTLFDNDEEGFKASVKYYKEYDLKGIIISKEDYVNTKDFSDLVKNYGAEVASKLIYKFLKKYTNENQMYNTSKNQ